MARLEPVEGGKTQAGHERDRRGKSTTSFIIPSRWKERVDEEAKRLNISRTNVYLRALTQYFSQFDTAAWETTDQSDYDPSRFYTRSDDDKGHSFHLRVNLPKHLGGEIAELVASQEVPQYRTTADVARDAIYHRTKQVALMLEDGKLEQAVDVAMMLSDEILVMEEATNAENLIGTLKANLQRMIQRSSASQTKIYLARRRDQADTLPEPYRTEYLEVIDDFDGRVSAPKKRRRKK